MIFKKIFIVSVIIVLPILFGEFTYKKSAGAHPGSTGAPGDNTCAKSGCHTGMPVTYNDTTVNKMIFSSADSTYVPGQTYTITVRTKNIGVQRFGFEIQALKDLTNTEVGTIIITDVVRTHLLTHTIVSGVRNSVTHSLTGTTELSPGFNEWSFDWTAPPVNEGDIVFYYATNSTNNNNASTGDAIYNNTFRIRPFSPSSINEFIDEQNFSVNYSNENNQILLNYFLKSDRKVSVKVFDNLGREVLKQTNKNRSKGQHKDELSLNNDLSQGVYYVNLSIDNKSISKKILIK